MPAANFSQRPPKSVLSGRGVFGTQLMQSLRPPNRLVPSIEYGLGEARDPLVLSFAAILTTPGNKPREYYGAEVGDPIEIECFTRCDTKRRIVFTSSISVFGPDGTTKYETTPLTIASDYSSLKLMARQLKRERLEGDAKSHLTLMRLAVVFGLSSHSSFIWLAHMLKPEIIVYSGRRNPIKSCRYVGVLVAWMLAAAARQQIFETFRRVPFPKVRGVPVLLGLPKRSVTLMRLVSPSKPSTHLDRTSKMVNSACMFQRRAKIARAEQNLRTVVDALPSLANPFPTLQSLNRNLAR